MAGCMVFKSLNLVGKKWTIFLLQEIELNGNKGFNFILNRMEKVTPKVLSKRLRDLEETGLITKENLKNPSRTFYYLTKKGEDFQELVLKLREWNNKYSKEKDCINKECVGCKHY